MTDEEIWETYHDNILQTPEQWAADDGIIIRDPDGWRSKGDPSFYEPTTYRDYYFRMIQSTIGPAKSGYIFKTI